MNRSLLNLFLIVLSFASLKVLSQETESFRRDQDYKEAYELFQKEKYSAAKVLFDKVSASIPSYYSVIKDNSDYYAALCALELFNNDAELLLGKYLEVYPGGIHAGMVGFQLGKYNYRKKQYQQSVEWFAKADEEKLSKEERCELLFKRGYSNYELGNLDAASKDFYDCKDMSSEYAVPSKFYFADISYRNKNYETAYNGFKELESDQTFAPFVPYYIAQILYLQRKYSQVTEYAPPLITDTAKTKRSNEIARIVAESYYKLDKYKQALEYYNVYMNTAGPYPREEWYGYAYCNYKLNNYDAAIKAFKYAVESKNDSLSQNAHYHLADCYLKKSEKHLALANFYSAYNVDFKNVIREDALYNYAKLTYELAYNPFNDAVKAFELYLNEYPDSRRKDEAYNYLVEVFLTTKNYEAALHSLEKIESLTPALKNAHQKIAYFRGTQLFNDKSYLEALKLFEKSTTYAGDKAVNAAAIYWMGQSCYQLSQVNKNNNDLDKAITYYKKFLFEPGAVLTQEFANVQYALGYAYFKTANYKEASIAFRKYLSNKEKPTVLKENDTYLRIADSYFMLKDYVLADEFYKKSIDLNSYNKAYAMFQRSILLGLLGKHESKSELILKLLKEYGNETEYEAAAKYELAKSYEMTQQLDKALLYYEKVIKEHPNTTFVPNAKLQTGNIQNKMQKYEAAIAILNNVIAEYPKSEHSLEAANIIREICKKTANTDCLDKLSNMGLPNLSVAKLDSDNYYIAKELYDDEKLEDAGKAFSKYLIKFPDGMFVVSATFYKAECDFKKGDYGNALGGYVFVADKPHSKFTEYALARAAWINYRTEQYANAFSNYARLEKLAEYKSHITDAVIGQMRCAFKLQKYDESILFAGKVILLPESEKNPELKNEAMLIRAKANYQLGNYDKAMEDFIVLEKSALGEKTAEAKYSIALIQHKKGLYKESQKTVFELINQKQNYNYWIGKGFLLIADNYLGLNDRYNARYTLKTYIEKSTNAELVEEAKAKLAQILEQIKKEEDEAQKKLMEAEKILFPESNPSDSTLFNDK